MLLIKDFLSYLSVLCFTKVCCIITQMCYTLPGLWCVLSFLTKYVMLMSYLGVLCINKCVMCYLGVFSLTQMCYASVCYVSLGCVMCQCVMPRCVVSLSVLCLTGVLLHYDDTSLQDIYFLDPQWLCDVLASVVTIREINSLAKSGLSDSSISHSTSS